MRFDVQPIAVIAALVLQQILGFVWFAYVVRCIAWLRRKQQVRQGGGMRPAVRAQLVSAACSAVAALALAILLSTIGDPSAGTGALVGLTVGLGFAGSSFLMNSTYEGRDKTATWIFITYQVVSLTAMGALLAAWR